MIGDIGPRPGPVAVTVEVPVSGTDGTVEVTVVLSARRVAHDYDGDAYEEPEPEPEPQAQPARPSAVFGGGGRIQGIAQPSE